MNELHQQIGPYQLDKQLQRNSLTTLYRATDTRTEQIVVLHLLHQELTANDEVVRRFLSAAQKAQSLSHRAIATVLDGGVIANGKRQTLRTKSIDNQDAALVPMESAVSPGDRIIFHEQNSRSNDDPPTHSHAIVKNETETIVYLVTQFVSAQTLAEFLRYRREPLGIGMAFRILKTVGTALDAAHAQEIVHGQISPETIFIQSNATTNQLYLCLDGFYTIPIAKTYPIDVIQPDASDTRSTATPTMAALACRWPLSPYMAPEQARDEEDVSTAADVYSLGALAHLLL